MSAGQLSVILMGAGIGLIAGAALFAILLLTGG